MSAVEAQRIACLPPQELEPFRARSSSTGRHEPRLLGELREQFEDGARLLDVAVEQLVEERTRLLTVAVGARVRKQGSDATTLIGSTRDYWIGRLERDGFAELPTLFPAASKVVECGFRAKANYSLLNASGTIRKGPSSD